MILIVFGILQNFLIFWNHFEDSTLHGTLRKKNFRKKYPKTCSKHFWTISERLRSFLEFWILVKLFKNISNTRPSMDYCAKNFSKKIPQNVFKTRLDGQFGNDFGRFLNFENFLIFWKHFEDSTLHGTLGKKISEKRTPKHVQNTFGQFGNDFGRFWNFENF